MVSVTDKVPIAVEKNRLLLPPNYNRYFMWGFPDYSARIATVEGDRVSVSINYITASVFNEEGHIHVQCIFLII